jgi:hypothetical protein
MHPSLDSRRRSAGEHRGGCEDRHEHSTTMGERRVSNAAGISLLCEPRKDVAFRCDTASRIAALNVLPAKSGFR